MSSILTNTSSMVALQTLKTINMNLSKTQNEISTGKSIATARDGAAIWSISKVMESDVKGFQQISNSLSLGQSTISVARTAAELVTDLLTEIKGLVVSAQEENVDRAKIQTDIGRLRDQINSIVNAAQFNGLSLVSNREITRDSTAASATIADIVANRGSQNVNILSSLDRASNGSVTARNIAVGKLDLSTTVSGTTGGGTDLAATAVTGAGAITAGASGSLTIVGDTATARGGNAVLAGDSYTVNGIGSIPAGTIRYVARDGDTIQDIARGLVDRVNFYAAEAGLAITATVTGANNNLVTITNNTTASITTTTAVASGRAASGGLELLAALNVTTENGARAALGAVEGMITTATNAAASLGSAQRRMDIQAEFVGKLTDSFRAGIGTLVDADMEEASARLQALQVQQQLGIQSLSIANQAPQSILALFR